MEANGKINACQTAFIANTVIIGLNKALETLSGHPIISISETDGFLDNGGMIKIGIQNNKVGFDINLKTACKQNINIKHQFLTLTKNVIH